MAQGVKFSGAWTGRQVLEAVIALNAAEQAWGSETTQMLQGVLGSNLGIASDTIAKLTAAIPPTPTPTPASPTATPTPNLPTPSPDDVKAVARMIALKAEENMSLEKIVNRY